MANDRNVIKGFILLLVLFYKTDAFGNYLSDTTLNYNIKSNNMKLFIIPIYDYGGWLFVSFEKQFKNMAIEIDSKMQAVGTGDINTANFVFSLIPKYYFVSQNRLFNNSYSGGYLLLGYSGTSSEYYDQESRIYGTGVLMGKKIPLFLKKRFFIDINLGGGYYLFDYIHRIEKYDDGRKIDKTDENALLFLPRLRFMLGYSF